MKNTVFTIAAIVFAFILGVTWWALDQTGKSE
jgi:hypothetical protein